MNHSDHVYLLEGEPGLRERLGVPIRRVGGVWADLGSGGGAFTLALADLIGPGGMIHSVDRSREALREQTVAMRKAFPDVTVQYYPTDFTRPLDLPPLDGIVMANSLHFIPDGQKNALLQRLRGMLKPGGQFLLVEYGADRGNMWVPYPLSFASWQKRAQVIGYTQIVQLGSHPSHFMGSIYSALNTGAGPSLAS